MTQWYGPQGSTYHASGQGGQWVDNGQGATIWQPYAGSSADPNKTIWYGPNANYPGANPVTYPAPQPQTGQDLWNAADPGKRSYRYFSPELQQYYEKNPGQAYQQYESATFGDRQTPLLQYANDQYSRYFADYIKNSEGNDKTTWTDYLTGGLGDQIRNSFNLQSPSQKGYTDYFQPSGRITW